jgi:predicted ATPase
VIARVVVRGYRCLRFVEQDLSSFMILVGPNASGKSTFLDILAFVSDALRAGVQSAVLDRAEDVASLFWMRESSRCDIAIEVDVPERVQACVKQRRHPRARYELTVGLDASGEVAVLHEALWLLGPNGAPAHLSDRGRQLRLFPAPSTPPPEVLWCAQGRKTPAGGRKTVLKKPGGNDYFFSETTQWQNPFKLGSDRLALAGLPDDRERFPISLWIRDLLQQGVQRVFLNSDAMRRPSAPGGPARIRPDGSNLPWVVDTLRKHKERYRQWLKHIRTALPDIEDVRTVQRDEDKKRFLMVRYDSKAELPSWSVSDGTLRLLALTLIAYIDEPDRIYLVEEPEDGIHPQAVETVFQSLSSAYSAQVLCTSHSPVVLALAEPAQLLCLARDPGGATDIVRGDQHPLLLEWRRGTDLGTLFAAGVLG